MKIHLVKVSADSEFKIYKAYNGGPPQNIFSVAAATADMHDIELFDETIGQIYSPTADVDLVVLFAATPDVTRAYELAAKIHDLGVMTVIGGLHATFMPEEAASYADVVLVGEEEETWPRLLTDIARGDIKEIYRNENGPVKLGDLKPYPQRFIAPYAETGVWGVTASRGCKFKCSFCTVHEFFPTFRQRPVGDVIDEIRQTGLDVVEIHADNLIANRDYAMELFEALEPLNISWVGEATLNIAEYEDILEAAARSGLIYLVVGLETCSEAALHNAGKKFIKPEKAKENIRRLHDYKIAVDSCMLFGFDEHDKTIFQETLDWVRDIDLDVVHPNILTPFPGTDFYHQLEREGRLLTKDWSRYDCSTAVFQPKQMSPQELEDGMNWFSEQHQSLMATIRRKLHHIKLFGWEGSSWLA